MGLYFDNLLVEAASATEIRKGLESVLKPRGLLSSEMDGEATFGVKIFGSKNDRFLCVVGQWPEYIDTVNLSEKLAKKLNSRVISACCLDSDALILSLSRGGISSQVYVGEVDAYDVPVKRLRSALWKELLGEDNWNEFCVALKKDYVYAEDALEPLARMADFSCSDAERSFDEPGEPILTFAFRVKKPMPIYFNESLPPTFQARKYSPRIPIEITFESVGGCGRGIDEVITQDGLPHDDFPVTSVSLGQGIYSHYEKNALTVEPERITLPDGRYMWLARFPDIDIINGINPEHLSYFSNELLEKTFERLYPVRFNEFAGWSVKPLPEPEDRKPPFIEIGLIPQVNRQGGDSVRMYLEKTS